MKHNWDAFVSTCEFHGYITHFLQSKITWDFILIVLVTNSSKRNNTHEIQYHFMKYHRVLPTDVHVKEMGFQHKHPYVLKNKHRGTNELNPPKFTWGYTKNLEDSLGNHTLLKKSRIHLKIQIQKLFGFGRG